MVKGVSKTVIVVNNTGSKLFEKIVFYVTPEYGNLNAKQLKKAASEFSFNYEYSPAKNLRKRYKRRLNVKLLCILGVGLVLLTVGLILIL